MIKTSFKVVIALIHNNDKNRYKLIKLNLDKLRKKLNEDYSVQLIEISKQPKLIPHPLLRTFFRKCIYWKLNREWEEYKEFRARNILLDTVVLIRRLFITFKNRKRENKRGAIETFLVDKHIKAWNFFIESEAELLICFEDDAIFKEDSFAKLKKIFQVVSKKIKDQPFYIDLAGGNTPEVNRVFNLESGNSKLGKFYKKPVTNTACCYLINQKTTSIFIENLLRRPWLRLIGADWLMNKFFMLTSSKYKYFCLHTNPSVFNHGSIQGIFKSSI